MSSSVLGLNNVKNWQISVRAQSFDSSASSGDADESNQVAVFSNKKKSVFKILNLSSVTEKLSRFLT